MQDPKFHDTVCEVRSTLLALKCDLAALRVPLAARGVVRVKDLATGTEHEQSLLS